jgi:hypothetical protein
MSPAMAAVVERLVRSAPPYPTYADYEAGKKEIDRVAEDSHEYLLGCQALVEGLRL